MPEITFTQKKESTFCAFSNFGVLKFLNPIIEFFLFLRQCFHPVLIWIVHVCLMQEEIPVGAGKFCILISEIRFKLSAWPAEISLSVCQKVHNCFEFFFCFAEIRFIFFCAGYPIRRINNIHCSVVGWGGMRGFTFPCFLLVLF